MNILALEPYHGGSHQAFLDGWRRLSRHAFTTLGLPAHSWKWRMRHAPVTLSGEVKELVDAGQKWDLLFASDMLNLAEFLGLAPEAVRQLPSVVYFHENQLTYPVRVADERDFHFAVTNFTTALAADAVWFNSAFHRDEFLTALDTFLRKMPDHRLLDEAAALRDKCEIQTPGIEAFPARRARGAGPMRIVWAARWEHDKDPQTFFGALTELLHDGVDFRVSVLGESFADVPEEFAAARTMLGDHVDRWGFLKRREAYRQALSEADVVVSTARHEFFGISVVEAMAAGALPIVPNRLAYPEVLGPELAAWLYDGSVGQLVAALTEVARRIENGEDLAAEIARVRRRAAAFDWARRAATMDARIEAIGNG